MSGPTPQIVVTCGDTVGIVVDASSRTAAFLKNGILQGVCLLPRKTGSISKKHLYIFTHLDASGDCALAGQDGKYWRMLKGGNADAAVPTDVEPTDKANFLL